MRPAWADIDLAAVEHNVGALRDLVGASRLCAVVKADGYGHGAVPVARAALAGGADLLAVALVSEGAELRAAGIGGPVLVLSQASRHELDDLVARDLEATVYTHSGVRDLAVAVRGKRSPGPQNVHLKVDTGMHRVGAQPAEVVDLARAVVEGISLNVRRLRGPAERYAGRRFDGFTVYGGGAQSDLWCQVLADVLGAPVRQLEHPGHANCIGIGLFAFARLGQLADADIAGRVAVRCTYRPDPTTAAVYDELADRFAEAFKATRPLFHHLHDARRLFTEGPS